MRVGIGFMILTVLVLLLGVISVRAEEATEIDAPSMQPMIYISDLEEMEDSLVIRTGPLLTQEEIWTDREESLAARLVRGVFRSRSVKNEVTGKSRIDWQQCGEKVPAEDQLGEAIDWVREYLNALDQVESETGYRVPTWGGFATMANESGFNECTFDYQSRKWATNKGLVDNFQQTYPNDVIWEVIHSDEWQSAQRKADFGPFQQRQHIKKVTRKWFDAIMSKEPGIYMGLREMARRAIVAMRQFRLTSPHHRPWMLWPGWSPYTRGALRYDRKITMVARWLGATKAEIEMGCLGCHRNFWDDADEAKARKAKQRVR